MSPLYLGKKLLNQYITHDIVSFFYDNNIPPNEILQTTGAGSWKEEKIIPGITVIPGINLLFWE